MRRPADNLRLKMECRADRIQVDKVADRMTWEETAARRTAEIRIMVLDKARDPVDKIRAARMTWEETATSKKEAVRVLAVKVADPAAEEDPEAATSRMEAARIRGWARRNKKRRTNGISNS